MAEAAVKEDVPGLQWEDLPDDTMFTLEGFSSRAELEAWLDNKLQKAVDEQFALLEKQIDETESAVLDVSALFAECEAAAAQFGKELQQDISNCTSQATTTQADSGAESDDDIQFIETTYDSKRINQKKLSTNKATDSKPLQPASTHVSAACLPPGLQSGPMVTLQQPNNMPQLMISQHALEQALREQGQVALSNNVSSLLSQSAMARLPGSSQMVPVRFMAQNPVQTSTAPNPARHPQMLTLLQPRPHQSYTPRTPMPHSQRLQGPTMKLHTSALGAAAEPVSDDVITVSMQPPKPVDLAVGMKLYGRKGVEHWYKGALVDILNREKALSERKYKVKFDSKGVKLLNGKNIAHVESPRSSEILPVGSRIIAMYRDDEAHNLYYAGIVAEPPNLRKNNSRYLVFFDDGYAQYSFNRDIHKVYEQSENVWEDIHPDSQEFIKSYLEQYPDRPMVRLLKGQVVKTEWNGKWWVARVQEVDASLVKMYFEADNRVEWIYRGSTRLEPLYTELANAEASKTSGKGRRHNLNHKSHKKPFVEYTRGHSSDGKMTGPGGAPGFVPGQLPPPPHVHPQGTRPLIPQPHPGHGVLGPGAVLPGPPQFLHGMPLMPRHVAPQTEPGHMLHVARAPQPIVDIQKKKPVARKSTAKPGGLPVATNTGAVKDAVTSEDGQIQRISWMETSGESDASIVVRIPRKKFVRHRCRGACLASGDDDPAVHRGRNPLVIPLLCGWERQISRQRNTGKRVVLYRAPCGRRLRDINEVDMFIMIVGSKMSIDLFCFDPQLHTDMEYVPVKTFCDIKDLSYGKETVPISCVNGIDRQYPDYVEYSNQRIPAKGVQLNTDPAYLISCDCTDGCRDPSKCACIQLTIEASCANPSGKPDREYGYQHRRLHEPVVTGIYECNSQCKCGPQCHNRVAQNDLSLRLQVFKTPNRGWGLRCLDDIAEGGFICIYVGQLLTEQGANEDGQQYGDEYLAELDYMEVVERNKEANESDPNEDQGIGDDDELSEESGGIGGGDISDSTYSGERRSKKRDVRRPGSDDLEVAKLVLKRDSLGKQKAWTVKGKDRGDHNSSKEMQKAKEAASRRKAEEWVRSLPEGGSTGGEEDIVIVSEGEDAAKTENSEDKNSKETELVITEPTSLCVDGAEVDSEEDHGAEKVVGSATKSSKKPTTRSETSRFRNLPDPKAQLAISPLKVKLSAEQVQPGIHQHRKVPVKVPQYIRGLFGGDEHCYVMDAKSMGNLGRYLNFSNLPDTLKKMISKDTILSLSIKSKTSVKFHRVICVLI